MLTFLVCLIPVVASMSVQTAKNYDIHIHYYTLMSVRLVHGPDLVLNLSQRNLHEIEKNAFENLFDVESLDLSDNYFTLLPEALFFRLTRLKTLSLARNKIWNLRNLFFGLRNLELLDISHNPIKELIKGSFFGLPKYTRILIDGNHLEMINTDMCSNPFIEKWTMKMSLPKIDDAAEINTKSKNAEIYRSLDYNTQLTICKFEGIVTLLDFSWGKLAAGCVEVPTDFSKRHIDLRDQNIKGFWKDWYQLYNLSIVSLDLSSNRITEIKQNISINVLADLQYINSLNMQSNAFENNHLRQLNFQNNLIHEIEDNAFARTRLHDLNLNGNWLRNLNFLSTLPDTMTNLTLYSNCITSIPKNAFLKLTHLSYLNLGGNKIVTLHNDVFRHLRSLKTLKLAENIIKTIEPAAFKGLTALKMLDLGNNFIRDLQANTFAKLTALENLYLNSNKIVNIMFTNLPRNLHTLVLDFNEISAIEKGSFVGAPRTELSLSCNRISKIARGAFNIPNLKKLSLGMNRLTTFESDIYEGLGRLRYLWLNGNQISEIRKGSCENLGRLYILDISSNPFQKLESDAFHGLSTEAGRNVYITSNNLKEIQVGLFDDI